MHSVSEARQCRINACTVRQTFQSEQAAHRGTCNENEGAGAKQAKGLLIPCAKDAPHRPCRFCCQRYHKAHLQENRLLMLSQASACNALQLEELPTMYRAFALSTEWV